MKSRHFCGKLINKIICREELDKDDGKQASKQAKDNSVHFSYQELEVKYLKGVFCPINNGWDASFFVL